MAQTEEHKSLSISEIKRQLLQLRERCGQRPTAMALTLAGCCAGFLSMLGDGRLSGVEIVVSLWLVTVAVLLWNDGKETKAVTAAGRITGAVLAVLALLSYFLPLPAAMRAWNAGWLGISGLFFWHCGFRRSVNFTLFMAVVFWILPNGEDINLRLTYPLRCISARGTAWIMMLTGNEVSYSGTELSWPGGAIAVTAACSGLEFFTAIVLIGFLMVLRMEGSAVLRSLVYCSILPCVLLANIVRLTLTMFVCISGGNWIFLPLPHQILGILTVVLAVLLFHGCTLCVKK